MVTKNPIVNIVYIIVRIVFDFKCIDYRDLLP